MNNNKNILIVEDEILIASCLKHDLEKKGFSVCDIVTTGESALTKIQKVKPYIILLDIRLAGEMTGIDVAEKIEHVKNNLKIIFMSGYTTPEIKEKALKLQPIAFLEKPVNAKNIIESLDN